MGQTLLVRNGVCYPDFGNNEHVTGETDLDNPKSEKRINFESEQVTNSILIEVAKSNNNYTEVGECLHSGIPLMYNNMLERGTNMNNDDILLKYIDKVDKDQSDLKVDIRESEKRIYENSKAMEERINSAFENLNSKFDKLDTKFDEVKDKVYESNKQYKWWIIGIFVAIIGVILASSYAVVQIITSIK